jgi:hypothetical protein
MQRPFTAEADEMLGVRREVWQWSAASVGVAVFLAAAVHAVLRGPAHTASRGRLAVLGLATLGAVFVPAGGGLAWAVVRGLRCELVEQGVELDALCVTPDESVVVASWSRRDRDGRQVWNSETTESVELTSG